jgi:endonuclease III
MPATRQRIDVKVRGRIVMGAAKKKVAVKLKVKVKVKVKVRPKKAAASTTKTTKTTKEEKAPSSRTLSRNKAPVTETLTRLQEMHPDAHCELVHANAFQLLVATVLSAQTTDVMVNKATPKLFERFPDPQSFADVESTEVEPYIATLGFFRQKSKSIVGLSKKLVDDHNGEVPQSMADLVKLPGVGRKTANVVLGVIWNTPDGVVVDTHVQRLSQRLGWTVNTDPVDIEQDLVKQIPREDWDKTSHLLIFHGRRICFAQKPKCEDCKLNDVCPSAFRAELVGRKPKRERPRPPRPPRKAAGQKEATS